MQGSPAPSDQGAINPGHFSLFPGAGTTTSGTPTREILLHHRLQIQIAVLHSETRRALEGVYLFFKSDFFVDHGHDYESIVSTIGLTVLV